jgi:hypothetical protein
VTRTAPEGAGEGSTDPASIGEIAEGNEVTDEITDILDPTQGASDATETAIRANPFTGPIARIRDLQDATSDDADVEGYAIWNVDEVAGATSPQELMDDVEETTVQVTDPFRGAEETLGTIANVAVVGTVLVAVLAVVYVVGQLVTFNIGDEGT